MITKIIYNIVPNHTTGQVGYSEREVGMEYQMGLRVSVCREIERGRDPLTLEPILVVRFENGMEHVIPYIGAEVFYENDRKDISEESQSDEDTLRGK